jgi:hypothetical protein
MVIMALAGLWALAVGRITITRSLRLAGRPARLYGATLLGVTLVLFLLGPLLERAMPSVLGESDAARLGVNLLVAIAIVVGLVLPFREKAEVSRASA